MNIAQRNALPKALDPLFDSFYRPLTDAEGSRVIFVWGPFIVRAVSSVVEHFVDIEGVTSSNLVPPTIEFIAPYLGHDRNKAQSPRRDMRRRP